MPQPPTAFLADGAHPAARALPMRTNFSWTVLGNIVYAACQWGMLMVLAKLGTPELVGQFALGLAVTAPLFLFSNLQLRGVQATDARGEYEFGHYLAIRIVTTVLAVLALAGVVLVARYRRDTALVVLTLGAAKAVEALSDVVYGLLQQHERLDRIAHSMLIKGVLSLGAVAACVHLTGSVLWAAVSLATVWLVVLVGYDLPSGATILASHARGLNGGPRLHPCWEPLALKRLAVLALPLGVTMMLVSLTTNIPRYFVEHVLGEHALGIFAAAAYTITAGTTVVGALGQSASPRLARHYAAGQGAAFRSLVLKLVAVGGALGAAGVVVALVAGRQLLTLVYTPEYAEHNDMFVVLMAGAGLGYVASFLGYSVTAARAFRPQLPLSIAVAGTTALACLWLIPRHGLSGAAWALLIGATVQTGGGLCILLRSLRRVQRTHHQRGSLWRVV